MHRMFAFIQIVIKNNHFKHQMFNIKFFSMCHILHSIIMVFNFIKKGAGSAQKFC